MTERLTESELEDVLCCDGCAINMTAEQIKSMALELKELRKEQQHIHEAGKENIDECAKCGHDIRHDIHISSPPERNEP